MKILETLSMLERIDQLIRLKSTGNPKEFARRLGISRSMLYEYLGILRCLGGPIQYNRSMNTYIYEYHVSLNIKYVKMEKKI